MPVLKHSSGWKYGNVCVRASEQTADSVCLDGNAAQECDAQTELLLEVQTSRTGSITNRCVHRTERKENLQSDASVNKS